MTRSTKCSSRLVLASDGLRNMTSAGHTSHPQVERISLSIPVDDTMPSPHQDEESVHDEVQHDSDSGSDETPAFSATIRRKGLSWIKATCDDQLGWISKKMDMRSWKPVIRSAIAAWVRLFDSHPHLARSFGEVFVPHHSTFLPRTIPYHVFYTCRSASF